MNFKIPVLIAIFTCVASVSYAQQSANEIIKYVEKIEFDKEILDPQFPIEEYSYVQGNGGIWSIDGDETMRDGLIPSGPHTLRLHYDDPSYMSSRSVKVINEVRQCNLEAGKSYHLVYRKGDGVVFEESPDNKTEFIKSLIDFSKTNPNHLNGTWSGEKKRLMNTFFIQYTIEGNRMAFEGKSKHAGMKAFVAEGRLLYNENIIIMLPDKATADDKEVENFSSEPKFVWYYTLIDGVLHIEGGRLFSSNRGRIWENTGDLKKMD